MFITVEEVFSSCEVNCILCHPQCEMFITVENVFSSCEVLYVIHNVRCSFVEVVFLLL